MVIPFNRIQHSLVGVTKWVLRQQQGGHASRGQGSTAMTCLDQEIHVAVQKALLHVDIFTAVRQQESFPVT